MAITCTSASSGWLDVGIKLLAAFVICELVMAVSWLAEVAGVLGALAAIVIACGVLGGAAMWGWRVLRRADALVDNTKQLPAFIREQRETNTHQRETNEKVQERLDQGAVQFRSIETRLDEIAERGRRRRRADSTPD